MNIEKKLSTLITEYYIKNNTNKPTRCTFYVSKIRIYGKEKFAFTYKDFEKILSGVKSIGRPTKVKK